MSSGSSDNGNWGGENLDWLTSYGIYAEWREEDEADEGTYDVSEPSETESESGSGSGSGGDSEPEHESENGGEGEDEDEAAVSCSQGSM